MLFFFWTSLYDLFITGGFSFKGTDNFLLRLIFYLNRISGLFLLRFLHRRKEALFVLH